MSVSNSEPEPGVVIVESRSIDNSNASYLDVAERGEC